jgi:hypothetical protein
MRKIAQIWKLILSVNVVALFSFASVRQNELDCSQSFLFHFFLSIKGVEKVLMIMRKIAHIGKLIPSNNVATLSFQI